MIPENEDKGKKPVGKLSVRKLTAEAVLGYDPQGSADAFLDEPDQTQ